MRTGKCADPHRNGSAGPLSGRPSQKDILRRMKADDAAGQESATGTIGFTAALGSTSRRALRKERKGFTPKLGDVIRPQLEES